MPKYPLVAVVLMTYSLTAGTSLMGQIYKVPSPPCIWTASFEYKQPPPVRPTDPLEARTFDRMQLIMGHVKLKTVYDTPAVRREVINWTIGKTTENWLAGNYLIFSALNFPAGTVSYVETDERVTLPSGQVVYKRASGASSADRDFQELLWITKADFSDKESYQGTMANHYVYPPPKKSGQGNPTDTTLTPEPGDAASSTDNTQTAGGGQEKMEAWIDAKTGFPLFMENADMRVTYTLKKETPTESEMKMPDAYQKIWDHLNAKP